MANDVERDNEMAKLIEASDPSDLYLLGYCHGISKMSGVSLSSLLEFVNGCIKANYEYEQILEFVVGYAGGSQDG